MISARAFQPIRWWRWYLTRTGGVILRFFRTLHEIGAFAAITAATAITKTGCARRVMRPQIYHHLWMSGVKLLPMLGFLAFALGLVIIGQTVKLLTNVGAHQYIGTVMATVVVRELGPLLTALVVLARAGTSNAVELGTARALGEVEALESLGVDPVHYLVVPRVIALAISVFCLTTYTIVIACLSGYLFTFVQDIPLTPSIYFGQLGDALRWEDFVFLALKTIAFGLTIAIVNCYHGLARPLNIDELSRITTAAVVHSVVGCILLDALFLIGYLFV